MSRKPPGVRRWFEWHSWVGVVTGLLLFIICWSGTFATISNELDWLTTPAMRVSAGETAPPDVIDIHDAVARAMPDATIINVWAPDRAHFAALVHATMPDGQMRHVYVDPASLEVTGSTSALTTQRFFRDLHMDFFGLLGWGKFAVCIFAIPLLISALTPLLFYKRWWRRFFDLRTDKGPKVFWSSLHKVTGLWSLWFALVIGITGTWYLVEETRLKAIDGKFALVDSYPLAVHQLAELNCEDSEELPFEKLIAAAQRHAPGLKITGASADRAGYFYVEGQTDALLVRDRANKMFLDPATGKVVYYQTAADLSPYWRWTHMADPIHFGTWGGLTTKILWCLSGLALSGLSLTGGWLHLQRLLNKRPGMRWRGTALAAGTGIAITLYCLAVAVVAAFTAGPPQGAAWPGVTLGTAVIGAIWFASTFGVGLSWIYCLRPRSLQRRR
ncbi:PepSY-associated TM helix domain-containing protein [Aurantiacibacter xanthus]|uniref:PepSY-associated TM helix domain-containing protein n=1 Tax=Aurantiacibacter xanthus TaxID=1784712 RepID=UPI00174996F4|nr:PepSY-associated TM helix domain-containing protein [Aurantiacibacter xanthus]